MLVAARDVPAGASLQDGDLAVARRPPNTLPGEVLRQRGLALGRVVSTPLQAGEVLTPARLVGRGLLAGRSAGDVAVPVRIADGAATAMLRPGSRIDVLVALTDATSARTVARGATVLAMPGTGGADGGADGRAVGGPARGESLLGGGGTDPGQGGLLLLAVPGSTAADLAQAEAIGPLSFLIR